MRRYLSIFMLALSIAAYASAIDDLESIANKSDITSRIECERCDTIIDVDGYRVRVIKKNGLISHIGLNLFSEEMKEASDKGLLDFIESSLFAKSQKMEIGNSQLLTITAGKIQDFKNITPDSACSVSHIDSRMMKAAWTLSGKVIAISLPTAYDVAKTGTRSEIEQEFIAKVKEGCLKRRSFREIDMECLEPYRDELHILPGGRYINRNINRNVYFTDREEMNPVWDTGYPLESIANIVLYPSNTYSDPLIDLTVLLHEYGEKKCFTVRLNQLLAAAEADGCVAFWGVEKYEDGILEGSIFLYNRLQGYDHVLKVDCDPTAVIEGKGSFKAKVSLFIPTNNVRDMFAPYIKKTDEEKIKYD